MRGRFRNALRAYVIGAALLVGLGGLAARQFSWGWILLLVIVVLTCILGWAYADNTARANTTSLDSVISSMRAFNNGVYSTRARGASTREVRALVDEFNKMAATAEHAITSADTGENRQMQFVSDVAHELRTPLTAIRGGADLMLDDDMPAADRQRFLSSIIAESDRLTRLAEDLLTLTRIEGANGEIPLRRFNPRIAVENAARALDPLFELRGVNFAIKGSAPDILGDVDRIQQVVSNLVDNATRMVGEGGHVWVELSSAFRNELGAQAAAKSFVDVDRFAIIAICDDGPGIPAESLPRIFDRFYRTDYSRARNNGGAGLGLSIVKAIVDVHGGIIEVDNRIGGGAQFTVYLPVPPEIPSQPLGSLDR